MAEPKKPGNALQAVLDRQTPSSRNESQEPKDPFHAPSNHTSVKPVPQPDGLSSSYQAPSRKDKRLIGGHFPVSVAKHLKILAAEEGTSVQALLEEALDLLFVKKGKGPLKRL